MSKIERAAEAHEFIDRCIKIPLGREDKSCKEAIKVKFAFQDYVGKGKSDLEYARALTGFLHRGVEKGNTYKVSKFKGDNSYFSAYDVFKAVLNGDAKTGNCLGLSQVGYYLLASKGIKVKVLNPRNHVFLAVNINDNWIPVETTIKNGFGKKMREKFKARGVDYLESSVWSSQGISSAEKGKYDLAINFYDRAIKLCIDNCNAYSNKGVSLFKKNRSDLAIGYFNEAIKIDPENERFYRNRGLAFRNVNGNAAAIRDFKKAIELNKDYDLAYSNLAIIYGNIGKKKEALDCYRKYASFNEKNAKKVAVRIKNLEDYLR